MMMNIFKVGEKVLCINNSVSTEGQGTILEVGKVYNVLDVTYCSHCGNQAIDVGINKRIICEFTKCHTCNKSFKPAFHNSCSSSRFVSVDNIEESLENAVIEENYELAVILRDLKIN